jgi:hypothetical protein
MLVHPQGLTHLLPRHIRLARLRVLLERHGLNLLAFHLTVSLRFEVVKFLFPEHVFQFRQFGLDVTNSFGQRLLISLRDEE